MRYIFVDAWAWIALSNRKDTDHDVAVLTNQELVASGYGYCTSNFVLEEALTNIRRWVSCEASVAFGLFFYNMLTSDTVRYIFVDRDIEQEAWDLFKRYDDHPKLSFVDCTSFAIMNRLGIREAFTNDEHFLIAGFTRVP